MYGEDSLNALRKTPISLSVIMPVFNEVSRVIFAIEEVLEQSKTFDIELIIVESGSTDGTRGIVEKFLPHPNVIAIFQDRPLGKGNAVRAGLSKSSKSTICIFDSDLEYTFSDIYSLLLPIAEGKVQFVLGSRWAGHSIRDFESHSWKARLLNLSHVIGAQLINLAFGIRARDPFTMWKVFTRSSVSGMDFVCDRFDWDLEIIGELALKGIKPLEVPATYSSRDYSQGKKIRFSKDVPLLLKIIFKIFKKRLLKYTLIRFGR
jgi:glycosyltransferase involved in cell wall biosynthesis